MCKREIIAENKRVGRIEKCSCGTYHLSIQGITIRLTTEAYELLSDMINQASDQLIQNSMQKMLDKYQIQKGEKK